MKSTVKLISVNIGIPREVTLQGRKVTTGIYKEPIKRRVMLRRLNLDGDKQANLSVHGGLYKAVYAYPSEHYEYWRKELPDMKMHCGMFGENFTTEGILEDDVCIGDRFRIGSAELIVTQPRMPCYKLGIKFGRADMVKRFLGSGRSGFYLAVLKEGEVGAGDEVKLIYRDENNVKVSDVFQLNIDESENSEKLQSAMWALDHLLRQNSNLSP